MFFLYKFLTTISGVDVDVDGYEQCRNFGSLTRHFAIRVNDLVNETLPVKISCDYLKSTKQLSPSRNLAKIIRFRSAKVLDKVLKELAEEKENNVCGT